MVNHLTYGQLHYPDDAVLTSIQFVDLTIGSGVAEEARPLRMDIDTQNGERLYLTVWTGDERLHLQRRATSTMALTYSMGFGDSTAAELAARSHWIAPHCPHQPGTADFGDNLYTFGRWDATATAHLAYSTDGGAANATLDPTDWGTGTTSWIGALETPSTLEVYAFLDNADPAELWHTTDHAAWSLINAVPFDVDPAGVSRHWGTDADMLIANRDATPATGTAAAQLPSPYTASWIASDGAALPKLADGGSGFPAIIWV